MEYHITSLHSCNNSFDASLVKLHFQILFQNMLAKDSPQKDNSWSDDFSQYSNNLHIYNVV